MVLSGLVQPDQSDLNIWDWGPRVDIFLKAPRWFQSAVTGVNHNCNLNTYLGFIRALTGSTWAYGGAMEANTPSDYNYQGIAYKFSVRIGECEITATLRQWLSFCTALCVIALTKYIKIVSMNTLIPQIWHQQSLINYSEKDGFKKKYVQQIFSPKFQPFITEGFGILMKAEPYLYT